MATPTYLTVSETAALLHVHPGSVRRWIRQGKLAAYRLKTNGELRVPLEEIDKQLTPAGPQTA